MSIDIRAALSGLINYVEGNECRHEDTHRGGAIWTICDGCGRKWADDRGGVKPYQEPKELTAAIAALDSLVAEPAEQPKGLATGMWSAMTDDTWVHADDARAAMQVRLAWWLNGDANSDRGTRADLMREACLDADAMQAERKRRQA